MLQFVQEDLIIQVERTDADEAAHQPPQLRPPVIDSLRSESNPAVDIGPIEVLVERSVETL
jgi:hypothetical protein